MKVIVPHAGINYSVETVEHIEHAFAWDGEFSGPITELFYAYHIKGGEHYCCSLDNDPSEYGYQCWDNEEDAVLEGMKALLKQLRLDDEEREREVA